MVGKTAAGHGSDKSSTASRARVLALPHRVRGVSRLSFSLCQSHSDSLSLSLGANEILSRSENGDSREGWVPTWLVGNYLIFRDRVYLSLSLSRNSRRFSRGVFRVFSDRFQ